MDFIQDLAEYERLIPVFKSQVASYFVSGLMSRWEVVAGQAVRVTPTSVELTTRHFSWERIPASLRVSVADYYIDYAPGYPISSEPKDLQYFFWGSEFKLHMWTDVIGGRKNPSINGMTMAGWTPFRNWLIKEEPEEAALLGSLLHKNSNQGKHELTDPLTYLKSLLCTQETYLLAGYALWRLQRISEDWELEEGEFEYSSAHEFGW